MFTYSNKIKMNMHKCVGFPYKYILKLKHAFSITVVIVQKCYSYRAVLCKQTNKLTSKMNTYYMMFLSLNTIDC